MALTSQVSVSTSLNRKLSKVEGTYIHNVRNFNNLAIVALTSDEMFRSLILHHNSHLGEQFTYQ